MACVERNYSCNVVSMFTRLKALIHILKRNYYSNLMLAGHAYYQDFYIYH